MMHLILLSALALGSLPPETQLPKSLGPPPPCEEGVKAAKQSPYAIPPPVFIRRLEAPRLLVFVHGLQGDGTTSWTSGNGAYWPTLVASDPAFKDFDIFVHEYVVRPRGPVRLADTAEQFVQVAQKNGLVSRYSDVVFVAEGDGVYFVRELLKRVRPFAARATMIFVAGRTDEVARPVDVANLQIVEGNELLTWRDYVRSDAKTWLTVEPKPWTHCAVLGKPRQGTVDRDADSSFCSTMPLSVPGSDWRALRPSCYVDPVYQAFRRSVGQYGLQKSQSKAPPSTTVTAETRPLTVPCQQTLERFIEVPLAFNPATEELLSTEAVILKSDKLKAFKADVERVVGNVAIVRYILAGLDLSPAAQVSGQPACQAGEATIGVRVVKRPKG